MRTAQEIQQEISTIREEIRSCENKIRTLNKERVEIEFSEFCEKHNLRRGDIVELAKKEQQRLMIDGAEGDYITWITTRKIRKDGNPALNTVTYLPSTFNGCKVVGHLDLD